MIGFLVIIAALVLLVLLAAGVTLTDVTVQRGVVGAFADAIAWAEGYYVPGSRPNRNNNPGDLTVDTIGKGTGKDGPYIIYGTAADGWAALRRQVELMFTGQSRYYKPNMTIAQVASRYTTTEQSAWASNVASRLGVSVQTRLDEIRG